MLNVCPQWAKKSAETQQNDVILNECCSNVIFVNFKQIVIGWTRNKIKPHLIIIMCLQLTLIIFLDLTETTDLVSEVTMGLVPTGICASTKDKKLTETSRIKGSYSEICNTYLDTQALNYIVHRCK